MNFYSLNIKTRWTIYIIPVSINLDLYYFDAERQNSKGNLWPEKRFTENRFDNRTALRNGNKIFFEMHLKFYNFHKLKAQKNIMQWKLISFYLYFFQEQILDTIAELVEFL